MKLRHLVYGLIIGVAGVIAWMLLQGEPYGKIPYSRQPLAREPAAAGQPDTIRRAADKATQAGENQRNRPSQPPVARDYPKPKLEYPVAEPIKDRPGFVLSPHNGKVVDLRDIPPGTLVADPTYPLEEKKYFRVPN